MRVYEVEEWLVSSREKYRLLLLVLIALVLGAAESNRAASVTLAWDPSSSSGVSGYKLYQGNRTRNYTNVVDVGNVSTSSVAGLVIGSAYFFAVTAYDTNGLESDFSTELSYTPPNSTPVSISLTSPPDGAAFAAPASVTMNASVAPNGHNVTAVQFFSGTNPVGQSTNSPYTWTLTNLAAGSYSLSASALYDSSGSVSSSPVSVTVTNLPSPVVALSSPSDGSHFTAPANVTMTASVTTNGHTINKVQFFNAGALVGEDTSPPYAYTINNLGPGTYALNASVVYDGSNSIASSTANVTVDSAPPPPSIALTSPSDGAAFPAPADITLNASVTPNGHNITAVQFFSGTNLVGQSTNSPYAWTLTNQAAGSYSLSASALYDSSGSVSSSPVNVTVTNLSSPVVALTSPSDGSHFTAPADVTMTASVTTNGHTIDKVQFFSAGILVGEADAPPYACTISNLTAGSYALNAGLVYDTSNSIASPVVNVTVDAGTNVSAVPPPWAVADIGEPAVPGYAIVTNSTYTINGAGVIGGPADQFTLLYQPMTKKGQIRAHLLSEQLTNSNAAAGLMMRETMLPDSDFVFVGLTGSREIVAMYRDSTSANVTVVTGVKPSVSAIWLRLVRTRSGFVNAYSSSDGSTWNLVASPNFTMAPSISFGFATWSGTSSDLNSAVFSNATISP